MGYSIDTQTLSLPCTNGHLLLNLTPDSGRIVYRNKVDTIIGILHPGIVLGTDQFGWQYVLHHHYKNRVPTIDRWDVFADGEEVYYDTRPTFYSQFEIIKRGLQCWWNRIEYNWIQSNCQHFVNRIAFNENKSQAIDEIANGTLLASVILGFLGLVTGNKGLVTLAVGVGISGGAVKMINTSQYNNVLGTGNPQVG